MDNVKKFVNDYADYALEFITALSNPSKRIFLVYLLVSLLFVYVIYKHRKIAETTGDSFLSFVFPKSVWSNPSAWLDVRYFFFHGLIGHFLIFGIGAALYVMGLNAGQGVISALGMEASPTYGPKMGAVITSVILLIVVILSDFMAFYLHYLQHKIPLLWQFHKVHHSGEVMHSLSNFREHPVDNLTYKAISNLVVGGVAGMMFGAIGFAPSTPYLIGVFVINACFNLAGYHLRHSHIWLKWPGVWSKIYGSPAHHHVHHSRHPDHLDKNFAFMLPIWDVLFKTYHMPEDNRDVEFGIVEDASELNSCVNLYLIPFRDAYRVLTKASKTGTAKGAELDASSALKVSKGQ